MRIASQSPSLFVRSALLVALALASFLVGCDKAREPSATSAASQPASAPR